ncbi:MAG: M48 family metallopeptidase [Paludibacteraceae bacterium]|nr:M48 family metallopeptidase [Paludibacteraceae bacterium]
MELIIDDIKVEVERRRVRSLRLTVYPDGRVRLVVPWLTSMLTAKSFVESRREWVLKHYAAAKERKERKELQYTDGEEHLLFGVPMRLRIEYVNSGSNGVLERSEGLVMYCRKGTDRENRQALMEEFYRARLSEYLKDRLRYYCDMYKEEKVSFRIRQMKREWGSCMARKRSMMFNLRLSKVPKELIDYVIVHEVCHLRVQNHSRQFWELVESRMPDYKDRKKELGKY